MNGKWNFIAAGYCLCGAFVCALLHSLIGAVGGLALALINFHMGEVISSRSVK
jgi:hypothetical protein